MASLESLTTEPRDRKVEALRRLGVTPEQLKAVPRISDFLRETRNGRSLALRAMRFSEQELISKFLAKHDSIPEDDRDVLSFEAIALAAGIAVPHLWGEIMLAIREQSVNSVKLIAVAAHPEVIKKTIAFAKTAGGHSDRVDLHTMLGALPSKTGSTFIGKFFAAGTETPEEKTESPVVEEMVDAEDFVFPDCEVLQEKVQPLRQKLLERK